MNTELNIGFDPCLEAFYPELKYRLDFYDPMIGTEFIGYWGAHTGHLEIEGHCMNEGYYYRNNAHFNLPHYIVEVYEGIDLDPRNRKTRAYYRYYKENPYGE